MRQGPGGVHHSLAEHGEHREHGEGPRQRSSRGSRCDRPGEGDIFALTIPNVPLVTSLEVLPLSFVFVVACRWFGLERLGVAGAG